MKIYGAALSGWLLGGLAPPVVVAAGVMVAVDAACDSSTDCSWGFELVLVVPVLLGAFIGTGPALVGRLVAAWVDPSASARAIRTTRWSGAISIGVLYLGGGSGIRGFLIVLAAVSVGVPAVVSSLVTHGRRTATEG